MSVTISGLKPDDWCQQQWEELSNYPVKMTDGTSAPLGKLKSEVAMRVLQEKFLGAPTFPVPPSAILKEASSAAKVATLASSAAFGPGYLADTVHGMTGRFSDKRWERLFYIYALIKAIGVERFNALPHQEVPSLSKIKGKSITSPVMWCRTPSKDRLRKDGDMSVVKLGEFALMLNLGNGTVMSFQYREDILLILVRALNSKTKGYNFSESVKGPNQIDSPIRLARFVAILERVLPQPSSSETSGREAP